MVHRPSSDSHSTICIVNSVNINWLGAAGCLGDGILSLQRIKVCLDFSLSLGFLGSCSSCFFGGSFLVSLKFGSCGIFCGLEGSDVPLCLCFIFSFLSGRLSIFCSFKCGSILSFLGCSSILFSLDLSSLSCKLILISLQLCSLFIIFLLECSNFVSIDISWLCFWICWSSVENLFNLLFDISQ